MKSKTFKIVLGIAIVSICGVQSISAQERGERKGPPTAEEMMKQMDADEDGFLSLKELEDAPKPKGRRERD